MIQEMLVKLSSWSPLDTWMVLTAAVAAAACALPGAFLLLRRQSMLGDALSHTSLLGIVLGYLAADAVMDAGWASPGQAEWIRSALLFGGAVLIGVGAGVLTEWIQSFGRVESSAALGVVYTTFFAGGLLLIRWGADHVDLDPGCVLFGSLEMTVLETIPGTTIPWALVNCGAMLLLNVTLLLCFYKELTATTFDPVYAAAVGLPVRRIHDALTAVTAATLVASFKSVGSILVIAMLIVPAASAYLLTDRLGRLLLYATLLAALSALVGHVAAVGAPGPIMARLGFAGVGSANTAGTMALAIGFFFLCAATFGPRYGVVARRLADLRLQLAISGEDLLGILYRFEEQHLSDETRRSFFQEYARELNLDGLWGWLARARLRWQGHVVEGPAGPVPTDRGRAAAERLVRSHRLWEVYLAKHTVLPADHLHAAAHRVEHYIDPALEESLAEELSSPAEDPHGRSIPTSHVGPALPANPAVPPADPAASAPPRS